MIFSLEGYINNDTVGRLVACYNAMEIADIDHLEIYMDSEGGDVGAMECLISMINTHSAMTELIAYNKMYSAAFYLFYRVKCKRRILPGTLGMCHEIRVSVEISKNGKGYYERDKSVAKWMSKEVWVTKLLKELKITQQELDRIASNEEVYFRYPRLLRFLKIQYSK